MNRFIKTLLEEIENEREYRVEFFDLKNPKVIISYFSGATEKKSTFSFSAFKNSIFGSSLIESFDQYLSINAKDLDSEINQVLFGRTASEKIELLFCSENTPVYDIIAIGEKVLLIEDILKVKVKFKSYRQIRSVDKEEIKSSIAIRVLGRDTIYDYVMDSRDKLRREE